MPTLSGRASWLWPLGAKFTLQWNSTRVANSLKGRATRAIPAASFPANYPAPLGVAGLVSTLAFLRGSPEEVDPDDVFDRLQSGELELSAADASTAEGFTLADVAFALDVLRTRWPVVEQEVEYMAPIILHGGQRLN